MKFKFIKKVSGAVTAYGVKDINSGDTVDLDGYFAIKAQSNPDFEEVKPEPELDLEPSPVPSPAPAETKKGKSKGVSKKADEKELELPLEPSKGEDDGEQEANI